MESAEIIIVHFMHKMQNKNDTMCQVHAKFVFFMLMLPVVTRSIVSMPAPLLHPPRLDLYKWK